MYKEILLIFADFAFQQASPSSTSPSVPYLWNNPEKHQSELYGGTQTHTIIFHDCKNIYNETHTQKNLK